MDSITQGRNPFRVRVVLHSGKNRVVRRLFEHFGYTIKKLERVSFASLSSKGVPLGQARHLKPDEIEKLKMITSAKSAELVANRNKTASKKPVAQKKTADKKYIPRKTTTKKPADRDRRSKSTGRKQSRPKRSPAR